MNGLQVRRTQIGRLLRLIVLLRDDGFLNTAQIAQMLEVSRRTVFRDLKTVEAAGLPVYYSEERRGYAIAPNIAECVVPRDFEEAAALIVQSKLARAGLPSAVGRQADVAIRRGFAALSDSLRNDLRRLAEVVEPESDAIPSPIDPEIALRILRAAAGRRLTRIYFRGESSRVEEFEIHKVTVSATDWRLLIRSPGRRSTTTIQASDLEAIELTDVLFTTEIPSLPAGHADPLPTARLKTVARIDSRTSTSRQLT